MLRGVVEDIRYGLRQLRRNPGFTAATVLTLALGIGANTAVFSVVHAVVLAPLPYQQPDRVALVLLDNRNLKHVTYLSYPDFLDWQRSEHPFEEMAAYSHEANDVTVAGHSLHLKDLRVTARFFATFGVQPQLGRDFTPQDDRQGAAPVAILSDELWRSRFEGKAAALGSPIAIDGVGYTVVGVLPPRFSFDEDHTDLYTPLGQRPAVFHNESRSDSRAASGMTGNCRSVEANHYRATTITEGNWLRDIAVILFMWR